MISRKNPALQDSPPAAGRFCDILPFRRSAILPGGLFHIIGDSIGISYDMKKITALCDDVENLLNCKI